jgi:hypothetical protein
MKKWLLPILLACAITSLAHAQRSPYAHTVNLPNGRQVPVEEARKLHTRPSRAIASGGGSWLPVGSEINDVAEYATIMNGELYVLYRGAPGSSYEYRISKWDGQSWTHISTFHTQQVLYSFYAYHGMLYVGGYFDDIDGIPNTNGIARLNNGQWEPVGGGAIGGVFEMIEYNGDLYAAGTFGTIGGINAVGIARWDGSAWHSLNGSIDGRGFVYALAVNNGKLYVGGGFTKIGNVDASNVAQWDGSAFTALGAGTDREIEQMAFYHNELYITGPYITQAGSATVNQLARWDGAAWNDAGTHDDWLNIHGFAVYNDELYAAGTDGDYGVSRWNGSVWTSAGTFNDMPNFIINYNERLFLGGWFTETPAGGANYFAMFCSDNDCGTISGNVFRDLDGNCSRDGADAGTANRIITINPGPYYTATNANGDYNLYVPPGTYTVALTPRPYWNQICPAAPGTRTVTLTSAHSGSAGNDFATQPVPNVRDMRMSLTQSRIRPGVKATYAITYSNVGTIAASGTIRLTLDPLMSFESSDPAPTRVNGNVIEWDYASIDPDASSTIHVTCMASITARLGLDICADAEFVEEAGGAGIPVDANIADDADRSCVDVVNSIDPNDLNVAPAGLEGTGEITAKDSILTYTVRFQNTGTAPAITIAVIDSLPSGVDPATIELGASSHPFTFSLAGEGIAKWLFSNVMLPDSGSDEPKSHGFFKYSVHLKPGMPVGTRISNRADIYFDFNNAVPTNTVISIISGASSVPADAAMTDVALYPNPTSGRLEVRCGAASEAIVKITDALGRELLLARTSSGAASLDLSSLPAGIYFVTVPTRSGAVTRQVTLLR